MKRLLLLLVLLLLLAPINECLKSCIYFSRCKRDRVVQHSQRCQWCHGSGNKRVLQEDVAT
jgi:hypothetical protein